jgi:hypothetical protein
MLGKTWEEITEITYEFYLKLIEEYKQQWDI